MCLGSTRVGLGKDHYQGLLAQGGHLDLGNPHRGTQEPDVERAVEQPGDLAGGEQLAAQVQLESWRLPPQPPTQLRTARRSLIR